MNNYCIRQESETSAGNYRLNLFIVKPLLLGGIAEQSLQPRSSYIPPYTITGSSKTFGQLENMFTGDYEDTTSDFERSMTAFYASLLEKQEPLGKEFEDVLDENRWNLYVRS
jgi:hypothetical protein